MRTLVVLLASLFLVQPSPPSIAPQAAQQPYVIDWIPVGTEQETDRAFLIQIRLRLPGDADVAEVLRPDPIEIRPLEGQGSSFRPVFRRVEMTLFEAGVTFEREGQWQLVLYPDVPEAERGSLPSLVPTEQTIAVTNPPPGWVGPALLALLAAALFAVALGGKERTGPPKKKLPPATGGDTWWTGG